MAKRLSARSAIEIKDIKKSNDAYYKALSARGVFKSSVAILNNLVIYR